MPYMESRLKHEAGEILKAFPEVTGWSARGEGKERAVVFYVNDSSVCAKVRQMIRDRMLLWEYRWIFFEQA